MKTLNIFVLFFALLLGCDIGGYLLVKPGEKEYENRNYDGCNLKFMLSTLRNEEFELVVEVIVQDRVVIFPDSLKIILNTDEIKYLAGYKKLKGRIPKIEVSSGKSYVYFGFNIEPGTVKKGDIFYISANNFFCDNNTCYDIEPIEFVNNEIFY